MPHVRRKACLITLKQLWNGEEIIREWWGDGGSPSPLAQDRADVCTGRINGKPCSYNYVGGWSTPKEIAAIIRRQFEVKNSLKLRVTGEESLGHCECCNCVLSLKVHVPRETIMNHTNEKEYAKFPPHCWLKTEQQTTQ